MWEDGAPGGETSAQVGSRADRVLNEVRSVEGDVALFAHAHLLRVLATRWLWTSSLGTVACSDAPPPPCRCSDTNARPRSSPSGTTSPTWRSASRGTVVGTVG
ncbi:MAG: histidine phosphatase family protein [Actinobacteria bacterium]|nr:histidine phosphatase family protein [Actinomycetota bacterium]